MRCLAAPPNSQSEISRNLCSKRPLRHSSRGFMPGIRANPDQIRGRGRPGQRLKGPQKAVLSYFCLSFVLELRIDSVAKPITEQIQGEDHDQDRDAGRDGEPGGIEDVLEAFP